MFLEFKGMFPVGFFFRRSLECHLGDPGVLTNHTAWMNPGGPGVLMNHTAWANPNVPRAGRVGGPNVPGADREW